MAGSCRECANCLKGEEQYCLKDFVLRIPDGLPPDTAAPLLCAGITTCSPLRHWGVGPGRKVAVVGLGGPGHINEAFDRVLASDVRYRFVVDTSSPA